MTRARPNSLEYGKSDVSGADLRGAGGGGGNFRSPAATRAAVVRANSTAETTQPVREFAGKSLRQIIENTSQQGQPTDELARQRYLKGAGGLHFRKGGKVRYASGGFVEDFTRGFGQGLGSDKKKRKDEDEELFPEAPKGSGGLYRKGGRVK